MAKQIQLRRGTTAEHDTFTGAVGELTYDTEKKQLRVHDGSTVGGNVVDDPTRNVTSQVSNATETIAGKAKIATTAIAQAGVNDTDFITARKLKETALGFSQTWKNVTASRTSGATYTNTTGRPIAVHVATVGAGGGESYVSANVGGVSFKFSRGGAASSSNFTSDFLIVPIGLTYVLTTQNASINEWMELS